VVLQFKKFKKFLKLPKLSPWRKHVYSNIHKISVHPEIVQVQTKNTQLWEIISLTFDGFFVKAPL